jgi:ATP-binding cassette, subfamily B, bacterial PglK
MLELIAKLRALLDERAQRQALRLLGMMVFGALLEAGGVGLVLPFVALLTTPDAIERSAALGWAYQASGATSPRQFLMFAAAALAGFFVFKNSYLLYLAHTEHRYVFRNQIALSKRLLERYLTLPYSFHLSRNSAELLRNVNSEALWAFNHVLLPLLGITSELFVMAAIAAVLALVAPALTAAALFIVGGVGGVFHLVIRRRIAALGVEQQQHNATMIRWVNQSLGSIRETKVARTERYFVRRYGDSGDAYADANAVLKTVAGAPRLLIETLGVLAILGGSFALMAGGGESRDLVPKLGVFALAAMRLMPSLNRVVASMTGVRFYKASVDAVYRDLVEGPPPPAPHASGRAVAARRISFDDVCFRFEGAESDALRHIDLELSHGSFVAIVGGSGAGKTTLLGVLLGLLTPTRGSLLIDGVELRERLPEWQASLGYIPQSVYLLDDSIAANVAFGVDSADISEPDVWRALEAAQLAGFVRSLPQGLATTVGELGGRLSGGQRQRVGIARALYRDPPVLVLDEATSALDTATEREFLDAVESLRGDRTIIMVTHRVDTARRCDVICFMADGRIVDSGPPEVVRERCAPFRLLLEREAPPAPARSA